MRACCGPSIGIYCSTQYSEFEDSMKNELRLNEQDSGMEGYSILRPCCLLNLFPFSYCRQGTGCCTLPILFVQPEFIFHTVLELTVLCAAHKYRSRDHNMPSYNPSPQIYHCRPHSCISSKFSVSASPFLVPTAPYSSSSICFRAMLPHVSLNSWKRHSGFFVVRRKLVPFHHRANTSTTLTGK